MSLSGMAGTVKCICFQTPAKMTLGTFWLKDPKWLDRQGSLPRCFGSFFFVSYLGCLSWYWSRAMDDEAAAIRRVEADKVAVWCREQGIANSSDLAFFFLTFDEALQPAGRAVADAWQSRRIGGGCTSGDGNGGVSSSTIALYTSCRLRRPQGPGAIDPHHRLSAEWRSSRNPHGCGFACPTTTRNKYSDRELHKTPNTIQ